MRDFFAGSNTPALALSQRKRGPILYSLAVRPHPSPLPEGEGTGPIPSPRTRRRSARLRRRKGPRDRETDRHLGRRLRRRSRCAGLRARLLVKRLAQRMRGLLQLVDGRLDAVEIVALGRLAGLLDRLAVTASLSAAAQLGVVLLDEFFKLPAHRVGLVALLGQGPFALVFLGVRFGVLAHLARSRPQRGRSTARCGPSAPCRCRGPWPRR